MMVMGLGDIDAPWEIIGSLVIKFRKTRGKNFEKTCSA
jgi:hypothetical protein